MDSGCNPKTVGTECRSHFVSALTRHTCVTVITCTLISCTTSVPTDHEQCEDEATRLVEHPPVAAVAAATSGMICGENSRDLLPATIATAVSIRSGAVAIQLRTMLTDECNSAPYSINICV